MKRRVAAVTTGPAKTRVAARTAPVLLPSLPTELLLAIVSWLPLREKTRLLSTCKELRRLFGPGYAVRDLWCQALWPLLHQTDFCGGMFSDVAYNRMQRASGAFTATAQRRVALRLIQACPRVAFKAPVHEMLAVATMLRPAQ